MLILSRRLNQSVTIGDDIKLKVCDLRGDKVRLGFDAPRHIAIHRSEVYEAIVREAGGLPAPAGDGSAAALAIGKALELLSQKINQLEAAQVRCSLQAERDAIDNTILEYGRHSMQLHLMLGEVEQMGDYGG